MGRKANSPWVHLLCIIIVVAVFQPKSHAIIFGADDRKEVFTQPVIEKLVSPSVAVMVSPVFLKDQGLDYLIDFNSISNSFEAALCKGEKFYNQPTASVNCTGFLVAPDLIMTAGHCVTAIDTEVRNEVTPQCADFLWIFDYKYLSQGVIESYIPANKAFKCKEVVYAKFEHTKQTSKNFLGYGDDVALIRIERKSDRPELPLVQNIRNNEQVYTVGYPTGLPQKVTVNGRVVSGKYENFFTTTLDIFGGNSGGPILNSKHQAIGVVVRAFPSEDYIYDKRTKCSKPKSCSLRSTNCKLDKNEEFEVKFSHGQKISDTILDLIFENNSNKQGLLF